MVSAVAVVFLTLYSACKVSTLYGAGVVSQWLSTENILPKEFAENAEITELMNIALELRNQKKKQPVEALVEQLSVP